MYHANPSERSSSAQVALSNDQLTRMAPAVFADQPHSSRSKRYVHIPTMHMVGALRRVGFAPYQVSVAKVRDKIDPETGVAVRSDRWGFQKHLIRFRHESNLAGAREGVAELVLINAHDGSCSYNLLAGWFEFLCANGLMCGDEAARMSVLHKGDAESILRDVAQGAMGMLTYLDGLETTREQFKGIALDWSEQQALASAALELRYEPKLDDDGKPVPCPLEPYQILAPRRAAELGAPQHVQRANGSRAVSAPRGDLWSTFNVIQENLIKGGAYGRQSIGKRITIKRQRGVTGIDQNVTLNRALWTLTAKMAELKAGIA